MEKNQTRIVKLKKEFTNLIRDAYFEGVYDGQRPDNIFRIDSFEDLENMFNNSLVKEQLDELSKCYNL